MKQLLSVAILAISLFATTFVMAQKENLTSKTATKAKGYTVLNAGEPVTIYKYQHASHSPKEAEKYGPKYFFTTTSSDELQPLTKTNLKKAFPENHPFHDALDATFKEDKELTLYDNFHKMYKVSWLIKNHS